MYREIGIREFINTTLAPYGFGQTVCFNYSERVRITQSFVSVVVFLFTSLYVLEEKKYTKMICVVVNSPREGGWKKRRMAGLGGKTVVVQACTHKHQCKCTLFFLSSDHVSVVPNNIECVFGRFKNYGPFSFPFKSYLHIHVWTFILFNFFVNLRTLTFVMMYSQRTQLLGEFNCLTIIIAVFSSWICTSNRN